MTVYTYLPNSDTYQNGDTAADVPLSAIGPNDTIIYPASTTPYTVTLPSNLTTDLIEVTGTNATVVIPSGSTVTASIVVRNNGHLDVGDGSSTAATTLNGTLSVNATSFGVVTATGTVNITSEVNISGEPRGVAPLNLATGADVTLSSMVNFFDRTGSQIVLGDGATLTVNSALSGSQAATMVDAVTVVTGSLGNATLKLGPIDNTASTLNLTGKPSLIIEPTSITGGAVVTAGPTQLYGATLSNIQIVGGIDGPSSSSPYPSLNLVNVTGIGIIVVPGSVTLEGSQDPMTYDLLEGSIYGPSALTFAPGSVINLVTGEFGFGETTFLGQTTLQGRLDVSVEGVAQNYTIYEYAPLLFAAGSSVEIDKSAFLEINGVNSP